MRDPTQHQDAAFGEKLDATLRAALADRPEPFAASNLAARVIDQARLAARTNRAPAKRRATIGEWLASLIAATALAAVVITGVMKITALEATMSLDDSSGSSSASSSASSSSADSLEATLLVGGAALAGTLVYLALQGSATLAEDRFDFTAESLG